MLFDVGELNVSIYVAESITNWLQYISATKASVAKMSCNQLLIG